MPPSASRVPKRLRRPRKRIDGASADVTAAPRWRCRRGRISPRRLRGNVDVALAADGEVLDAFEDADLDPIDLAHAIAARLDLLGREIGALGNERDFARPAFARVRIELDVHFRSDLDAVQVRDRDVDLHILVARIENRKHRRTRLRKLARPQQLRLRDGWDIRRADLELRVRDLELRELARGQRLLAAQHFDVCTGGGNRRLFGAGSFEDVGGALGGGLRSRQAVAGVVEHLLRRRAASGEAFLTLGGARGKLDVRARLLGFALARTKVLFPARLAKIGFDDRLLDLARQHVDLLPGRLRARGDIGIVDAGNDGRCRHGVAFAEVHVEHASADLASQQAFFALDETGVAPVVFTAVMEDHEPDHDERGDRDEGQQTLHRASPFAVAGRWAAGG